MTRTLCAEEKSVGVPATTSLVTLVRTARCPAHHIAQTHYSRRQLLGM